VTLLVACGSARPPAPRAEPPPARGTASPGDRLDTVSQGDHPGELECDELFAHAIAVEAAERPADQRLDADALEAARAELRAQHMAECRTLSRETYRCVLAAARTAEIAACQ
jgi:hypothetical protein